MIGTALAVVGGVLEVALSAVWFWLMRRVRIPADRRPLMGAHAVAAALGVAAIVLGTGGLGTVLAASAVLGGALFFALQAVSGQARKVPAVAVGGPILDFTLPDDRGRSFDLATLRGKPFLLKFFRGHW